jgi:hypothetical protein
MKVTTTDNQDAQLHVAELLAVIDDSLRFGGGLQSETRYFFETVKDRFRADCDYLANNMRKREPPTWGYECFDDSVNSWAS